MERQLRAGDLQVSGFFDHVRVRVIDSGTLRQFDPDGTAFTNLNTPGEVQRVLAMVHAGKGECRSFV